MKTPLQVALLYTVLGLIGCGLGLVFVLMFVRPTSVGAVAGTMIVIMGVMIWIASFEAFKAGRR